MTNPTQAAITDVERELLTHWKAIEAAAQNDPSAVVPLVKAYATIYSKYRIARVASTLWDANKFTPARELLIALEDM